MPDGRQRAGSGRALVWKRFDFRESSRIVALLLRDQGIVHALAKGAHRPDSPLLGRLDFLNELDVRLSADREGLRLLLRAELVHEPRSLRQSRRFLAASHFVELCDFALPQGRPDPELFDLCRGGLVLLERCPAQAVPAVVMGLELRLLAHLGALPDLDRCAGCGAGLRSAFRGEVPGALTCRRHAAAPRRAVGAQTLDYLRTLRDQPGRTWPALGQPPEGATALPAVWLSTALERRCQLRRHVFAPPRRARPRAVDSGA